MIYSRLITVLFCLFCFSCKTDTSKNKKSDTNDTADTVIDYNKNVPAFISDTVDTVINNVYTRSYYDLLETVSMNNNNYRIYAYYAHINDTFYYNKCFRHILVTNNNQVVKKLYEFKKLEENLRGDNFRQCQHIVKTVEINTSPYKTIVIVYRFNQSIANAYQYALLRFDDKLRYSEKTYNIYGYWFFGNNNISSNNLSFYITLDNHYFKFKVPIILVNKGKNNIMPALDTSKVIIDDHYVVIDINKKIQKYNNDTTYIRLYDSYKSSAVLSKIYINKTAYLLRTCKNKL